MKGVENGEEKKKATKPDLDEKSDLEENWNVSALNSEKNGSGIQSLCTLPPLPPI